MELHTWRNQLWISTPANQVMEEPAMELHIRQSGKVYQTLCILIDEHNLSKFNTLLQQFILHWISKEHDFIKYFKQQHPSRPGKLNTILLLTLYIYILSLMFK